jgi:predicted metal-dependent hydrolase
MNERTRLAIFDRAVRRWNDREFHEAHEDWEALWNEAEGEERRWLQGLIQWAAALFHFERGFYATGFAKLMRQGAEKAAGYAGPTWGIHFDDLLRQMEPWLAHGRAVEAGRPLRQDPPPLPVIRHVADRAPEPLGDPEPLRDGDPA